MVLAHLTCLKSLSIRCSGFSQQQMEHLSALRCLLTLDVDQHAAVDDQLLAAAARLSTLTALRLRQRHATCSSFAALGALTALRQLELSCCKAVTTLAGLDSLTALRSLTLDTTSLDVPARQCQLLSSLKALTSLEAGQMRITGACRGILDLPALRRLHVHSISVRQHEPQRCPALTRLCLLGSGQVKLATLLPLPSLRQLAFYGRPEGSTELQDADVSALLQQTCLTMLHTMNVRGSATWQRLLAGMTQLRTLRLSCAGFQASTYQALRGLQALLSVHLRDVEEPALRLGALLHCTQLTHIDIQQPSAVTTDVAGMLLSKPGLRRLGLPYLQQLDRALQRWAAACGVELC